jgi:hypothetical protein
VADYQWALGLAAGVVATSLGTALNHVFVMRREAAARRREAVRAVYNAGKQALAVYTAHRESPYDSLDEGDCHQLWDALTEPFGKQFAQDVVNDFFDKTATTETFDGRTRAMEQQLREWERELDIPPGKDLAARKDGPP